MIESQPGTVTKGCESAILYFCRSVNFAETFIFRLKD